MSSNFVPRLIFLNLLLSLFFQTTFADFNPKLLKDGNKLIFIRHALAPGNGDPEGFKINDCKTQRNLNQTGINQAKKIGIFFRENKIKINQVLTSQWCRCKDTARYAFKNFKEFNALNSTYQSPYDKNEAKQIKELKKYVKKWKNGNLVLVTHYSIITSVTNAVPSSGEIVITDKNFKVLSTILID